MSEAEPLTANTKQSAWDRKREEEKRAKWIEHAAAMACSAGFIWLLYENVNWEFLSSLDFKVVYTYRTALLKGLGMTLLLTLITMVLAVMIGVTLAILYRIPSRPIRAFVYVYVEVWRNTPLLVQLFWVHFALPEITGYSTPTYVSGVIAMTLQASAYLTEIARAGIDSVPKGQWEASYALAIPRRTIWTAIVLPQAFKIMIPPLANTSISFFKATTILSLLAVDELMTASNNVAAYTFQPFELLTLVGIVYFVLGYIFSSLTYKLETTLKRSDR